MKLKYKTIMVTILMAVFISGCSEEKMPDENKVYSEKNEETSNIVNNIINKPTDGQQIITQNHNEPVITSSIVIPETKKIYMIKEYNRYNEEGEQDPTMKILQFDEHGRLKSSSFEYYIGIEKTEYKYEYNDTSGQLSNILAHNYSGEWVPVFSDFEVDTKGYFEEYDYNLEIPALKIRYDNYGNILENYYYDYEAEEMLLMEKMKYGNYSQLIEKQYYYGGKMKSDWKYYYDEYGNLLKMVCINEDGIEETIIENQYTYAWGEQDNSVTAYIRDEDGENSYFRKVIYY